MGILFDGINHPSAQQVLDAGCIGCVLYGGTRQFAKNFTPGQYRDYKARGLLTPFVFEDGANDMAGGANAGSAHASALLADLRRGGVLNTEPVGATVDEHVVAANIELAVAYQRGFWSYVRASGWAGPVGAYGFSEFLIAVHNAGLADWYWGAGSRSAMPPWTNIWQDNTGVINVGGAADDRDWILIPLPGGDMPLDPANPNDATVIAGAKSCVAGVAGQHPAGDLYLLVYGVQQQLAALDGSLGTTEASILAAIQNADADVKAGITQLATSIAAVGPGQGPTDTQVQSIEAALAAALKVDVANITLTVGTKP